MTPLQAIEYAASSRPVFPCRWAEPGRKRPLTPRGFLDASCDPAIITKWWSQWPEALIGMPTGPASGLVVLDIDVKDCRANGLDTLEDLGHVLPTTPFAHTANNGVHVYFTNPPHRELRNSAGLLGPGLDVRGTGGYVILPSPGSGYYWDPLLNFDTVKPAAPLLWLWPPPRPSRPCGMRLIQPCVGLSPYGEAALDSACAAIIKAGRGEQESILNAECFSIGSLAGAGAVPTELALKMLLHAAHKMPDHDPTWPWRPEEIDAKVRRAFDAGMRRPRERQGRTS